MGRLKVKKAIPKYRNGFWFVLHRDRSDVALDHGVDIAAVDAQFGEFGIVQAVQILCGAYDAGTDRLQPHRPVEQQNGTGIYRLVAIWVKIKHFLLQVIYDIRRGQRISVRCPSRASCDKRSHKRVA